MKTCEICKKRKKGVESRFEAAFDFKEVCSDCRDATIEKHYEKSRLLSVIDTANIKDCCVVIGDDDLYLDNAKSIDVALMHGDDGGILHIQIIFEDGGERKFEIYGIQLRKGETRFYDSLTPEYQKLITIDWVYETSLNYRQYWQEDIKTIFKEVINKTLPSYTNILEIYTLLLVGYLKEALIETFLKVPPKTEMN